MCGCSLNSKENKSSNKVEPSDKEVKNNQESSNNKSNSEMSNENDEYLGYWYEKKESLKDYTPSTLYIKSKNDKELVFDLYISIIGNFDNVKVNLTDNSFEAISENALSNDGEKAKMTGKIIIKGNEITFNILTSNLEEYHNNTISFKYKMKDVNIADYKGIWYQNSEHAKDKNPSTITIKNVEGNHITFDLYISRTAQFDNIKVKTDVREFSADSDSGVTKDDIEAHIDAFITLVDDEIILVIRHSNIQGISDNTVYTFKYKEYNNK